jgi:hypothetical protein
MSQNPPGAQQVNLHFMDFGDTYVNQLALVQSTVWQFNHKEKKVTIFFPFGTTIVLKGKDYEEFCDWRERTVQPPANVAAATPEDVARLAAGGGNSGKGTFKRP